MFEARPLASGIGIEIVGLDLASPLDTATRRALYATWLDAGILLFRGIGTSPARHLELSRCFGELEIHPVAGIRLDGAPEVIRLRDSPEADSPVHYIDDDAIAGRIPWHTDMIYTTRPCRGALLRMIAMPPRLGQTGWIDTAAAYDALDADSKSQIERLSARFDFVTDICDMRFGRPRNLRHGDMGTTDYGSFPPVAHPLVWVHPESGRRALMLSPVHLIEIVGMPRAEGDRLLERLVAHTTSGAFSYVHDWAVGDMVLWDNWRTMHMAFGTPADCSREVQRTTLRGEREMGRVLEA